MAEAHRAGEGRRGIGALGQSRTKPLRLVRGFPSDGLFATLRGCGVYPAGASFLFGRESNGDTLSMRKAILPYALVALVAGCGDGGSTAPTESFFEVRNFRVEPATSTGTQPIRFLFELRINPAQLVFTNLAVDGEFLLATSSTQACPDWCDTLVFTTTAESFPNLGSHRAVLVVVDAETNTAVELVAMFTVN